MRREFSLCGGEGRTDRCGLTVLERFYLCARVVRYVKRADVRQDVVSAQKLQGRRHLVVG